MGGSRFWPGLAVPWRRAGLSGLGDPGDAPEGPGEGIERADAVTGGGGEVGADRAEFPAPVIERMQPETLIRSLLIRMVLSASLLSNGTRRSRANRR